jgi:hypothetical protein
MVLATKFCDYVLMKSPEAMIFSIRDVARTASSVDHLYKRVKVWLTGKFSNTQWQLIFSLMELPNPGGCRPSVRMEEMLDLLPRDEQSGSLFLGHSIRRLPEHVQDHLAAFEFKSPSECA